jgi:hypothetical protein
VFEKPLLQWKSITITIAIIIIIIIIKLTWSYATCRPVPVSHNQKYVSWFLLVSSALWSVVFLVFSVVSHGACCLHTATCFYYIPELCTNFGLCSVRLQSLCLLYNLSKCILLLFSLYFSSAPVIILAFLALMAQF